MKEELESIRLACIWHSQQEINISTLKSVIRGRCNDIERRNLFLLMAEKFLLVFYKERSINGLGMNTSNSAPEIKEVE
jgi:hypothetical protein